MATHDKNKKDHSNVRNRAEKDEAMRDDLEARTKTVTADERAELTDNESSELDYSDTLKDT